MAECIYYAESYRERFMSVFPELVKQLTDEGLQNNEIRDGIKHLKQVLEYNVPKGKCNRGLMVIGSLCHLVTQDRITPDMEKKSLILGWCVEWLQGFFLVADDIMDQSTTRRGQPCWYTKEKIGLMAINDSFLIEGTIYCLLRKYFRNEPYYVSIMELFHEVTYQTEVGQSLDMLTSPSEGVDVSTFTIDRYKAIVKYKTAFYSFYLPVALAMYMVGISDEVSHKAAKSILLQMGEYFQIQDDYIDCYGDPAVTGKIGTDIEECKCGWLVVQALNRVTPQQKEMLKLNYGKNDPECVKKVKQLYNELQLQQVYIDYEEQSYQDLMITIDKELQQTNLPKQLFVEFADRIYKRKK